MKPTDWLKTIFEATGGIKHPCLSLTFFLLGGCLAGYLGWKIGADASAKDRAASSQMASPSADQGRTASPATAPAQINTTNGQQSPILPNNSGNVTISSDGSVSQKSTAEGKPK